MPRLRLVLPVACIAGLLSAAPAIAREAVDLSPRPAATAASTAAATHESPTPLARRPLRGKVIVLDPGHQLGNARHPRQINRPVNAGGFKKACNSTGTATNGGFPEATFSWKVSQSLRRQLTARGATVYRTRHTNSYADWGPCIDTRGRRGNKVHADAVVSIHGDGADAGTRGFFVIMPARRQGWTNDIYRSSHRLGLEVRRGLARADVRRSNAYGGDGLDKRGDLGTLNWSNRPIVMVELGNMRNRSDARHMTSGSYRSHRYARGLRLGVTAFVLRR